MSEQKPNFGINLLTGGIAGIIGTTAIFPIDLIKTRMQTFKGTGNLSYFDQTRNVIRSEGPRGLYRGLFANIIGVAPEKAIKLAANDLFRAKLAGLSHRAQGNPDKLPPELGMLAGAMAGTTQVIATNPMETVKIRMQMAAVSSSTIGVSNVAVQSVPSTFSVVKDLGFKGLYRGSIATLSRDVPFSMLFFQSFAYFKNKFSGDGSKELGFPSIFAAGITAGAISAFLVTPMDVVKTRYQSTRAYTNLLGIYKSIYLLEGPKAFFKGAMQRCFIVSPLFGISLTFYEIQRKFLNKYKT